jgi:OOP family OmpA-OmpF porin
MKRTICLIAMLFLATPAAIARAADAASNVYLVFFAFDRAEINPLAARVLDKVIADFQRTGSTQIDVRGHADLTGSAAYNLKLSERRALAVKDYLVTKGVKGGALRIEWFGKAQPRVPTPAGVRSDENRRTEIVLKK